jgi:hypothetical protein
MRWVMRQLIVRKLVVSIGEKEVSYKRPFMEHAYKVDEKEVFTTTVREAYGGHIPQTD